MSVSKEVQAVTADKNGVNVTGEQPIAVEYGVGKGASISGGVNFGGEVKLEVPKILKFMKTSNQVYNE